MNNVNLLEVYYDVVKAYNEEKADEMLAIVKKMPIEIISDLKDDVLKKVGYLKAKYKISLADSIALAETMRKGGSLVTSDHHKFEPLEKPENIKITWYR